MALSDITGVFSRYFIVGFFLPAYISLVSLWLLASTDFIPNTLQSHSQATQLLILGGVALVVALALSGFSYYTIRLFEGYPLERIAFRPVVGGLYSAAIAAQARAYERRLKVRDDKARPSKERARAAWLLERHFPRDRNALLPTRMGNAIRAFERHSNVRWGLDGITISPRINALLSAEERELHLDPKTDLYVFINASLGAFVVGLCLVIDEAINVPVPAWYSPLYSIPFVLTYFLYRAALDPAMRWGDAVRSSFDIHRLELYEKLGVRAPKSFSDEREIAARLNYALLLGEPLLGDDLWRRADGEPDKAPMSGRGRLIDYIWRMLRKGGSTP